MKTFIDRNYGANIDGNYGITVYEYVLEPTDDEEIVEQIKDKLSGYDVEDYPISVTVVIDDIEFEVDVGDYLL